MSLAEICQEILLIYQEYVGSGVIVGLFFASVLYIMFAEKKPQNKLVLGLLPLGVMIVFACPLFAWLIYQVLDSEIYYRLLWLLPLTIVIAYAGVRFVLHMQGIKRVVSLIAVCGIIIVCGDYVYDNQYFTVAENAYHVPDTVKDICDVIQVEGREVRAVFPDEMIQYVRQYTPYVCMPYGREMLVDRWVFFNDVHNVYVKGDPDGVVTAENLTKVCRENGVHYIIWPKERFMEGELTAYNFELMESIDGFEIYVDKEAYLGL